jgi:hypothetical protein
MVDYCVRIGEVVSRDLAFREEARRFFDFLENRPKEGVVVDFEGVRTISRSFAHEYILRKKSSSKNIREINMPPNIAKMFDVVQAFKTLEKWLPPPNERNTMTLTI